MRFVAKGMLGLAGAIALIGAPVHAAATIDTKAQTALAAMQQLNVIVLGNYSAASDVEGRIWVGGNATGTITLGAGRSTAKTSTSTWSTLTVGGTAAGTTINLNDGATNGSTVSGGNYGVTIGGDANVINFNANSSVSKIGGNLTSGNGVNIGSNSSLTIAGYVAGTVAATGKTTISVGSTQGSNVSLNGGDNSSISVHSGNVNTVQTGAGSTVQVGGNVSTLQTGSNSTATVTGSLTTLNGIGTGSVVKAATFASANDNAVSGSNVYISGSDQNQNDKANGTPAGWHFNVSQTLTAPAAPTVSAIAISTMATNMKDLTSQLQSLSNTGSVSINANSGNPIYTFNATSTGGDNVFTIDASLLTNSAASLVFNTGGSTAPIVVNVTGVGSGFTWNAKASGGSGTNQSLASQIIWNITGTNTSSSLNINTEVFGSILDAYGTVSNSGGNINGTLVASVFNQGAEVHLSTFDGGGDMNDASVVKLATVSAVPETSAWIMMIFGFGFIGNRIRKQKAQLLPVFA